MVLQSFNNIFFPWNILHFLNREIMWKFKLLTSSVQCFSRLVGNYLKKKWLLTSLDLRIFWKSKNRKMMFRINSIWLKSDFWSTPYFSLSQPSIWRNPATGHRCIVNFVLTNGIDCFIPQLRCFGCNCLAQWRQAYLSSESRPLRNSEGNSSKQY